MKYLLKITKYYYAFLFMAIILVACDRKGEQVATSKTSSLSAISTFDYQVDTKNFSLTLDVDGKKLSIANAMQNRNVTDLKKENGVTSWTYPDEKISVRIEPMENFLSVSITSDLKEDATFSWPQISANEYYIPLGEGKRIPATNATWIEYLSGSSFSVLEQFSMPFWASSVGDYAVMYIMENPHRLRVNFAKNEKIEFNVSYEYPEISDNRTKHFRIYVTKNSPVTVAKIYKNYVIEKGNFLTLEQKSKSIPNIKKLYGAPFIYLWGNLIVSPKDIKWNAFYKSIDSPVINYFLTFAKAQENGTEFINTLKEIKNQDYVGDYQKNIICNYLSSIMTKENFWNDNVFKNKTPDMNSLLKRGIKNLSSSEKIQLYKYAIATNLPDVFEDTSTWMNDNTIDLIRDLKKSGIENAWIGLHGWEQAFAKPELVNTAIEQGYLIASYDSYHSIHEPGKEQWETAKFDDTTLYEQATVTGKDGKKLGGFQNVGRKLNPVLAMPSVKERIQNIVKDNKLNFNSWFVDCDATGEIYDDYSPTHITTEEEDITARMQRMAYIQDMYNMVVGSEGGNDFASTTIALSHGIELKTFSWIDVDMNKNKDSKYYIGKYFSPTGGVAEHFSKRVPLKEKYNTLFIDPSYDIPLYKLVYNDSVISGYHWDWSTFKIKNTTRTRMLREILYNVPPLYHLDAKEWAEYKNDIVKHTAVWFNFSKQATMQEMSEFLYLSADGLVQSTEYGENIRVIANFSNNPYYDKEEEIPAGSAMIYINGETIMYSPDVAESHK